ncbi:DUF6221 family protein [Streptomyces sp. NPDC030592]|uniref:DUF6221 family protein n=1 Tax=Streptomyces sp. NPDC030592 TaxID=3155365 RepID=UPI0033C7D8B8
MDDLVQWLRAQLDDDERTARAATGEEWDAIAPSQPYVIFDVAAHKANKTLETVGRVAAVERAEDRAHIARHDPARVLREIDAKRQLFAIHRSEPNPDWDRPGVDGRSCTCCITQYPCPTLRLLALPYADRPGYREEWRP